ncbi:HEPN domain-containing protein [Streptomyces lydicus]|uniref:ApeA N-terminal domain 1-containing protein n=1 Tax=Streptomyces lydicus TaxID=47763 RepID=UPI0034215338
MDKELQALMSGTVGFFWPISATGHFNEDPERGFVSKANLGRLEVRTLNENPDSDAFSSSSRVRPHAIVSLFPEGSAVILNISNHGGTSNIGGRRASAYSYTGRTAISGFPVEQLLAARVDVRVKELHAHFPGISQWAGLKVTEMEHERKPDGRVSAAVVRLKSPEEVRAVLGPLSLVIGGHWEVDNGDDRASIYSPVSIGVKAKRARNVAELLEMLVRVQDLVNVAYDTYMPVDGGIAVMSAEAAPDPNPRFWSDRLMEGPGHHVARSGRRGLPLFTLADMNGASGVSRWVRLYDEFPSVFDAVVTPYRVGSMSWSGYMRETAVGIDRLIAASKAKGRPAWASVRPQSYALARRVGAPFADFVGDVKEWADLFWAVYNGGKHHANYDPDLRGLSTLAISGNLLLTAYLLQRCGMPRVALDRIFRDRVNFQLRAQVRELVKNPPEGLRPTSSY